MTLLAFCQPTVFVFSLMAGECISLPLCFPVDLVYHSTLAGVTERVKEGSEILASCSGSRVVINSGVASPAQHVSMCACLRE